MISEKALPSFPDPELIAAALKVWSEHQDTASKEKIVEGVASITQLSYRFEPDAYALPLFRVITEKLLEGAEQRNQIATFSYPPPAKCQQARANKAGCPVFYLADNPVTALRESNCKPGEWVCVSKWQFRQPQNALFYLFLNEDNDHPDFWTPILKERELFLHNSGKLTPAEEEKLLKLHKLFSDVFMGDDYSLSAVIGHYLLYEHPEPLDILLYPSQADRGLSSNLAVATRFADKHFKLAKVYRLKIGQNDDYSDTQLLEVGTVSKDAVVWRKVHKGHKKIDSVLKSHSYREMKGANSSKE